MLSRVLAFTGVACVLTGCFTSTIAGDRDDGPPPECRADSDCAHFDTDGDPCTRAICRNDRCDRDLVRGTAECQCHSDADCTFFESDCSVGSCDVIAHKCSEKIVPAGPAPASKQREGDCKTKTCDGVGRLAKSESDPSDVPEDDKDPCTVEACGPQGDVVTTAKADGDACGDGSICFKGKCLACKPQNPTSCGAEGPGEPSNDNPTTPFMMGEYTPFCAFGSGTDVDWYRFYAQDADFVTDIMRFEFYSKAPMIEVCAYAKCDNGQLPDGCSTLIDGPNGARGCCWSGPPATLKPSWDMDCPNTGEDSATVWVSVKMPGANACEPYAMWGGY
jgi:hypothetical protein